MVDMIPTEYAVHLVTSVAQHRDVLLGDSDMLDVSISLSAPLVDCCEQQETVSVSGKDRMLLDIQPSLLGRPLSVDLNPTNYWKKVLIPETDLYARPVGSQTSRNDAEVLSAVHPHRRYLCVLRPDPARRCQVVIPGNIEKVVRDLQRDQWTYSPIRALGGLTRCVCRSVKLEMSRTQSCTVGLVDPG